MIKWNRYICKSLWGGGTWDYVWDFEIISNTERAIKVKRIKWDESPFIKEIQLIKKEATSTRIKDWLKQCRQNKVYIKSFEKDYFVVYPNMCWIPFKFTLIK